MFSCGPAFFGGVNAAGDPDFANVVLLVHFDGTNGSTVFTNVVQALGRGDTISGTNPSVSTTDPLFGTGCGTFSVSGLQSPAGPDYNFGTGDYSIEIACKTATPSATMALFDMRGTANNITNPAIFVVGGQFCLEVDGATFSVQAGTVATSTWQRVGVFKVGATTYMMIDGTIIGSFANSQTCVQKPITIGSAWDTTSAPWVGQIDECRVTKGVGRCSANYTVDAVAFPDF